MLANHVFLRLILFYTHLLFLLKLLGLWLSIVTLNDNAKPSPNWFLREFDLSRIRPRLGVTPLWNVYMAKFDPCWESSPVWQTELPALAGHPTYHVNMIKLKWGIIWTGGLPHLNGLPHVPGVPHLHVNRPQDPRTATAAKTSLKKWIRVH